MLFKGKSNKLEVLIGKIQATREHFAQHLPAVAKEELSVGGCSWDGVSDGRGSLSPSSSVTPTSASETDVEAASTVGVTQNTPYQCAFCDKAFPRLSYLKRHEQTHADQLPFRCEFCGRHFKHKRSRDRHVKLHTGDKKYKCCHCEAAFSRSDHLKIHLKTHDTQKPYQCTICNRGYNTAAALTAHMQNHKAKLTAQALNQLLKEVPSSSESVSLGNFIKESSSSGDSEVLNRFLRGRKKTEATEEHLTKDIFPNDDHEIKQKMVPSVGVRPSSNEEPQAPESPSSILRCPVCSAHCRSQNHLQRHLNRHKKEDSQSGERPASTGGASVSSSLCGGIPSGTSTPSPRPSSAALPYPRPPSLTQSLMVLVGNKLGCSYCGSDGFPSLEALQLHVNSIHGPLLNGDLRDPSVLGLSNSIVSSLNSGMLVSPLPSPLGSAGSSRQVTCELCGARVAGVSALQRHVVTAHTFTDLLARTAEGVFCAQCLLPFSNPGALAEHMKLVHANPSSSMLSAVLAKRPPSPPKDVPTDLSKKSRKESNVLSNIASSMLLCNQCNAAFNNFESFRAHLKSHIDGIDMTSLQLSCPECSVTLPSESALEAHVGTHLSATSTEYGCQACLKLFAKPDELQKHLMDIHAHHLYRCALCKEMFDSKVSIQVHFAVKHSNECKVHRCTRCNLMFRTQSEFDMHVRISHLRRNGSSGDLLQSLSNGSYRCLLCPMSLSTETELSAHIATHQRQFQCSLCDEAFHVEFLLDKHMQNSHNLELNGNAAPQTEPSTKVHKNYQRKDLRCDICDDEFATDSALISHRKQSHTIKSNGNSNGTKVAAASLSLFCAYCSESCKSRVELEVHMKTHQASGGRHKCNICDELCPSAAMLAQHKLTHVKVLSGNICSVCREPLTTMDQVQTHQSEHHPTSLPQPCVVCRQTLVADIEVKAHARFHAAQAVSHSSSGVIPDNPPADGGSAELSAPLAATPGSSHSAKSGSCSPRSPGKFQEILIKYEQPEDTKSFGRAAQSQNNQASTNRTYQCIKCQESFASETEIENHVATHLLQEGSSHECHLCQASLDTPLKLQCHLIEHTFEGCGSFTCYMCSSVFTTASRLQQHMVEHGLASRPYDCHHCHLKFFFRAELENHILSHPDVEFDKCQECVVSFPEIKKRSGVSKCTPCYSCPICSHVGRSSSELRSHLLSHHSSDIDDLPQGSQDKKCATCSICGGVSRNAFNLSVHQLTHDGVQPYTCSKCGFTFSRHCEAIKHVSMCDSGEYKCARCDLYTDTFVQLQDHTAKLHSSSCESLLVRSDSRCSSCEADVDVVNGYD